MGLGEVAELRGRVVDAVADAGDEGGEEVWELSSLRGRVVVLAVGDRGVEPRARVEERQGSLVVVVVLATGEEVGRATRGRATVRVSPEAAAGLGVRSLAAYVVIDREGRVAAVGRSEAVMERAAELAEEPRRHEQSPAESDVPHADPQR